VKPTLEIAGVTLVATVALIYDIEIATGNDSFLASI
jgi:hypothetical protein